MEKSAAVVIPSTLQRLRCFMAAEGTHRVRPWAGVDETLDAFYRLLMDHAGDDKFWRGLGGLSTRIAADLRRRQSGQGVLDNEVLDSERYDELLAEIRGALRDHPAQRGAFRAAVSRLSAPAVSLLFLLGGAATVGCYDDNAPNGDSETVPSGGTDTGTDPAGGDTGDTDTGDTDSGDTDTGDTDSGDTDTGDTDSGDTGDTDSGDTGDTDSGDTDTGDTDSGDTDTGDTDTDFSQMSLRQIVETVVEDATQSAAIITCIESLDESWETGLESLFQGETEEEVASQLNCLLRSGYCENPDDAGEYDLDTLLNNCAVPIYIGVRFE